LRQTLRRESSAVHSSRMGRIVRPRPFISYAHEDHEIASKLYEDLHALGAQPWLDTNDLLGGQDWQETIRRAVRECSHFIALLSSNSVSKRGFVQKELRQAIDILEEFPPGEIFVIPVRLERTEPAHAALKRLHWIDLFPSYEQGLKKLARSLHLKPARITAPAPPPSIRVGESETRPALGHLQWIAGAAVVLLTVFILAFNGVIGSREPQWTDQNNCTPDESWVGMNPNTTERAFAVTSEEARRAVFHGELRWSPEINQVQKTTSGKVELEVDGQRHVIYQWDSPDRSTHAFEVRLDRFLVGTSGRFKIRWKWVDGTSGVCVAKSDVRT
jgi:hypothetical protein